MARQWPPTSVRQSRATSSISGCRRRRRPSPGGGAPSRSRSTVDGVSRRLLLPVVAAFACGAASAAPAAAPPLEPRLTKALSAPSLSLGRTAALAVDLGTGATIYAHNPSLPVAPA